MNPPLHTAKTKMLKRQREWGKPPFEFRKRRLDLAVTDGGAWFAANTWWTDTDKPLWSHVQPDMTSKLRNARGKRFHLLGMLLETQAVLCDKVVVHLCAANALEKQLAPHLAARHTMHTLCDSFFACEDEYCFTLRNALIERYCYKTNEPDVRLVIAVFQQLQLPFGCGYFVTHYPLPLHRFPVLKPGHYVKVNHRTLNEWRDPVIPFSCLATGYEHVLAFVQVWWNVLQMCACVWNSQVARRIVRSLSVRHMYLVYAWELEGCPRIGGKLREVRNCATFIWEKECKQSIFCDD